MEVLVELQDLRDSFLQVICHSEEMKIVRRHQPLPEQMAMQELRPGFPICAARFIYQHDRNDPGFAGLHESEALKSLVHRTKPARKERNRVGFFEKIEFASKEIVEEDQLRISIDDLVGSLLERQPNVQSEAVFTAGTSLGRDVKSADDLGVKGDTADILRSFRFL